MVLAMARWIAIELPAGQGSLRTHAVMTGRNNVIHLHRRDPQEALARLNRITGLHFARWPESLLEQVAPENLPQATESAVEQSPSKPEVSSG